MFAIVVEVEEESDKTVTVVVGAAVVDVKERRFGHTAEAPAGAGAACANDTSNDTMRNRRTGKWGECPIVIVARRWIDAWLGAEQVRKSKTKGRRTCGV